MSTLLVIILVIILLGGGGGWYGYNRWGYNGLGGVLGLIVLILVLAWLFGGLHVSR